MHAFARFFNLERSATLITLAIVCWQLFIPPILGSADNGDYARVMTLLDLTHAPKERENRYFGWVNRHYVFDPAEAGEYAASDFPSSEWMFVAIAAGINWLFGRSSLDLVLVGAVHAAAFGFALYLVLAASKVFKGPLRTMAVVLSVFAITDIAYIAYFNSFYCESASLIFLLLVTGAAYKAIGAEKRGRMWIGAYLAASGAFVLAKYQNLVLMPLFLLFGYGLVRRKAQPSFFSVYVVLALIACYGSYRFYISSPAVMSEAVLYNSVFNGILVDSPNPKEDLTALGLDPKYSSYAGTGAFQTDSLHFNPEFVQKFQQTVSMKSIVAFYARRPVRLIMAVDRTVGLAFLTRPKLGNYEKAAGKLPGAQSTSWAMWSTFRSSVLPHSLWCVVLVAGLYLTLLGRKWARTQEAAARLNLEWCGLMVPLAFAQLLLVTISDGLSDVIKHAFLFNLLFDGMLLAIGAQVLAAATVRSTESPRGAVLAKEA